MDEAERVELLVYGKVLGLIIIPKGKIDSGMQSKMMCLRRLLIPPAWLQVNGSSLLGEEKLGAMNVALLI